MSNIMIMVSIIVVLTVKVEYLVKYTIVEALRMENQLLIEAVILVGKFIIFEIPNWIWVFLKVKLVIMEV